MRIFIIQHVDFEGPGKIKDWGMNENHIFLKPALACTDNFPDLNSFDMLVIMGGPMGVYDDKIYPWLLEEKKFIGNAITTGKYVLGVCLGAQLIADVLGAKVYKNAKKEIGWFDVEVLNGNESVLKNIPKKIKVFQWHGDTFDLPKGSLHLFSSDACINQGFLYKDKVLGLQFHLESDKSSVSKLIKNCKSELVPGKYIQSKQEIFQNTKQYSKASNQILFKLLDNYSSDD